MSISCKYSQHLPKWAIDCLEEARGFRDGHGKLPLLILMEKGRKASDALYVMRGSDWHMAFGKIEHEQRTCYLDKLGRTVAAGDFEGEADIVSDAPRKIKNVKEKV